MKNKKIPLFIGVTLTLIVAVFFVSMAKGPQMEKFQEESPVGSASGIPLEFPLNGTTTLNTGQNVDTTVSGGRYVNSQYAFSFAPPPQFMVTSMGDIDQGGGAVTTILVEDQSKKKGVQIVISPWDEAQDALTPERIKRDIPDMGITGISVKSIENIGQVIEFGSDNVAFGGKSHEVWFVAHGWLYQMSTYAENKEVASSILSTWSFR